MSYQPTPFNLPQSGLSSPGSNGITPDVPLTLNTNPFATNNTNTAPPDANLDVSMMTSSTNFDVSMASVSTNFDVSMAPASTKFDVSMAVASGTPSSTVGIATDRPYRPAWLKAKSNPTGNSHPQKRKSGNATMNQPEPVDAVNNPILPYQPNPTSQTQTDIKTISPTQLNNNNNNDNNNNNEDDELELKYNKKPAKRQCTTQFRTPSVVANKRKKENPQQQQQEKEGEREGIPEKRQLVSNEASALISLSPTLPTTMDAAADQSFDFSIVLPSTATTTTVTTPLPPPSSSQPNSENSVGKTQKTTQPPTDLPGVQPQFDQSQTLSSYSMGIDSFFVQSGTATTTATTSTSTPRPISTTQLPQRPSRPQPPQPPRRNYLELSTDNMKLLQKHNNTINTVVYYILIISYVSLILYLFLN